MMSWSENIWKRGMPQYERILRHPFLRGLADGTLAPERFARYMAQDELYLPAYCSFMHRLAGLMPDEDDRRVALFGEAQNGGGTFPHLGDAARR